LGDYALKTKNEDSNRVWVVDLQFINRGEKTMKMRGKGDAVEEKVVSPGITI